MKGPRQKHTKSSKIWWPCPTKQYERIHLKGYVTDKKSSHWTLLWVLITSTYLELMQIPSRMITSHKSRDATAMHRGPQNKYPNKNILPMRTRLQFKFWKSTRTENFTCFCNCNHAKNLPCEWHKILAYLNCLSHITAAHFQASWASISHLWNYKLFASLFFQLQHTSACKQNKHLIFFMSKNKLISK